jgi:hypothetical protein
MPVEHEQGDHPTDVDILDQAQPTIVEHDAIAIEMDRNNGMIVAGGTYGLGMRWVNELIDRHGRRNRCLFVDADEALVFPGYEDVMLTSQEHEL